MKLFVNKLVVTFSGLVVGGVLFSVQAKADNLVVNGDFSQASYSSNNQFGTGYGGQGVTGWTGNGGYNIFFMAGTANNVSANSQFGGGAEKMWGVNASPTGGNFVALDGDSSGRGGISQEINNLVVGQTYDLTFDWGAGQLQSRTGPTTEQLQVSLGDETFLTPVLDNASQGFTGWYSQSFTFTATSTSELLSFLSIGTPNGLPPVAVLSDVSLTSTSPVPEPSSLALLGTGLVGFGGLLRSRLKSRA
jgi:hypothetical protein